PAEVTLRSLDLVDAHQATEALVAQALAAGPGIQETEQMLAVIQKGIDSATGCGRFIPRVELRMLETGFAAGPGDSMRYDNRWDACLALYWNLSDLCTAKDKLNKAYSQQAQAEYGYQDLKGRLTMGVQESQQLILASQTQLTVSAEHA